MLEQTWELFRLPKTHDVPGRQQTRQNLYAMEMLVKAQAAPTKVQTGLQDGLHLRGHQWWWRDHGAMPKENEAKSMRMLPTGVR